MNFALNRPAIYLRSLFAWVLLLLPLAACATSPVFLTGSNSSSADPFYGTLSPFSIVPVGKTMVVPIEVSGSGPISYTAVSTSPALLPVIKTGYPVMNVHVTYTGTTGTFSTLHAFTGTDGASPTTTLSTGTGSILYGVTATGGSNNFGAIYQITTGGTLNSLYSFTGGADGESPEGPLATGTAPSLLYGVTEAGGTNSFGTIYTLTTTGSLSTVYTFTGGADGGNPFTGLTFVTGSTGGFYGVTANGGAHSAGTIFKFTTTGSFTTLYSFTGGNDGAHPESSLALGSDGNLYGTTIAGGTNGDGAIYEISTTGSFAGTFAPLYSFSGGTDGAKPYGDLAAGSGLLYGTAETGGTSNFGTVYQITNSGTSGGGFSFSTLYTFNGGADGGNPYAGPVLASDGNIYGVTETDGTDNFGTIYQLTTAGAFTTLYTFTGAVDGGNPYGALLEGVTGDLFGTTSTGGTNSKGTIFQIPLPNAGSFSGTMKFALLRDMAPMACGYISGFAQSGFYDGLDFFRITNLDASEFGSGFIAQGGDVSNTGTGSVGFTYDNEYNPALIFDGSGQLALANSGNDSQTFHGSNTSEFFFTQNAVRGLDFGYTIFGQLISGFDIMSKVVGVPLLSTTNGETPFQPVKPVVMDSVTVSEDNTDAILFVTGGGYIPNGATINVNATDHAGNKAVSVTGSISTPGLAIPMATGTDTVNDPPFIVQDPNVNVGLHQSATLPFHAVDLEFDYLNSNAGQLSSNEVTVTDNGNTVSVSPSAFEPVTSATIGFLVSEVFVTGTGISTATAGLGLGNITGIPVELSGSAGAPVSAISTPLTGAISLSSSACAAFTSSNLFNPATDYTASVNWGDGTITSGSTAVTVAKSSIPGAFTVLTATNHTYSNAGIYPVNITVTGSNGGLLDIQSTAVVNAGPIHPAGRTFTAARGFFNGLVASFADNTSGALSASYTTSINWGDGKVTAGSVRGGNGNFEVYGRHQYTVGNSYPVDITVSATSRGISAYAWSTAQVTAVPVHLPPVAQSHISGEIGNPGFDGDFLSEEVTLVNSGDVASGPISLRFYLSPDNAVDPINSSAIPLAVGGRSTYNVPSIKAGSALQGSVSKITLPANAVTRGKFIIMQVTNPDPIGSHMDYPRAFASEFSLIE